MTVTSMETTEAPFSICLQLHCFHGEFQRNYENCNFFVLIRKFNNMFCYFRSVIPNYLEKSFIFKGIFYVYKYQFFEL